MDVRPKVYTYHTSVKWTEHRKGIGSAAGKPDLEVATPPNSRVMKASGLPKTCSSPPPMCA